MVKCTECNKKLSILSGYKHPIKGKKYPVCGHCFEVANTEVMRNRDQVLNEMTIIDEKRPNYFPITA